MPNDGFNAVTEQNDDWRTPDWLFKALHAEFAFDVDAAADFVNTKLPRWSNDIDVFPPAPGLRVFCNPPYSNIEPFVTRALRCRDLWVFILPVRTRASWFEMLCLSPRVTFRWLRKRIAFDLPPGVKSSSPRVDTFIAIVRAIDD